MNDPAYQLMKREFAAGLNAGKKMTVAARQCKESKSFWGYGVQIGLTKARLENAATKKLRT